MNRMRRVRRARMRQNRDFWEQAAHRMSLECATLERVHLEQSDDALNQLRVELELARTEQVADDVLRVGIPSGRAKALVSMMFHRLDVLIPPSRIRLLSHQNSQRGNAVELNTNSFGIRQVEEFTFRRLENLALAMMRAALARLTAVNAERPRAILTT